MPRCILVLLWMLTIQTISVFAAPLETTEVGSGKITDNALRKLAPPSGFIADEVTWKKLWSAWRANEETPRIDFTKELILVGTVPGPNLVIMRPTIENGDVKFTIGGTKIGGPGFGYRILKISRAGVKSINGNALRKEGPANEESITVKVVGTLQAGIVAIGGETTGVAITAKGVTWELDLGNNQEFLQTSEKLNGKKAVVEGRLEKRQGVEIPERWIVTVTAIKAAG